MLEDDDEEARGAEVEGCMYPAGWAFDEFVLLLNTSLSLFAVSPNFGLLGIGSEPGLSSFMGSSDDDDDDVGRIAFETGKAFE